jgi:acetyl esterase/lipase
MGQGLAYGSLGRQKLDVYAPPGRSGSAPVMVFFYGGSWDSGRRQDYSFAGHALASLGFLTVVPDYRLYPEVRFPDFLDDCAQAVRWARDHAVEFGGDASKLALCGHSAGAYNAVMLALDRALLAKAGVEPQAVKAVAGLSGPYNFLPLDVKATLQSFGGYPDLSATQPMAYARGDAPPTFLAWGDSDTLVGRKNIAALDAALRQVGVPVESKIYPGVDHAGTVLALSRPFRGKAPLLTDMQSFFRSAALL